MALRSVVAFLVVAAVPVAAGYAQTAETAFTPSTRYVSDQLSINLRRGPGNEYRITELLRAGSRTEVLEQMEGGWSRVRTADGEEGYVLTRFLSDTPAARDRLAAAQRRAARLEEANAELKQELVQALDGSEELGRLKQDLVAENESLRNEVAEIREASANAVRISEENREFRQRLLALQSESEQLRHENKALKSRREGMKVGALVLAAGILIGLILPLFRGRRRSSSWDSL
jgi:SH3 domain protein